MYISHSSASNRSNKEDEEEEEDSDYDVADIQWSDAIFIPFHPMFRLIVLICVIHKTYLGPLQGSFAVMTCTSALDYNIVTKAVSYFYHVFANGIYCLDTFLHIVHRQVTDKAVRREHLPKSAFLILLDVLSLIPFDDMLSSDSCEINFWPNILSFAEFIIIYRVVEYFELLNSHNLWKLYIGYTITTLLCINCIACFFILLTLQGLCADCTKSNVYYDWRRFIKKDNESEELKLYFYGYQYMVGWVFNNTFDLFNPTTLLEILMSCFLMLCAYGLYMVLFLPKFFSEGILSLRWISTFHPHVNKLIQETKRRNPSPTAYTSVQNFYNLMWIQRAGIINTPEILAELPRYLRIDIRQDLIWQIFYHSPTLRKTSGPFKRYICEMIRMDYKLPGARFFTGSQSNTNLYYLQKGIVQLISMDDGLTPLLSVSGGTLFGDINFFTYPMERKLYVKCLTYCEVLYITRNDLLKALHRYPEDRKNVLQLVQEKMKHAKTLYSCKLNVKGLDRTEDEGMDWLKKRWWEISDSFSSYKRKTKIGRCEIPPEESFYHCAKYIGQLVLCNEAQLKKTSLFVNDKFPWVLSPKSTFIHTWHIFVNLIVLFVLITFPPNLSRTAVPPWFITVKYFVDFVYIADICVSLCTSLDSNEEVTSDFASVMLVRFKKPSFVMDVFAALWIENITNLIGKPEYYYTCQFNRLLKIYMLFPTIGRNWSIGQDHTFPVYMRIFISYFSFFYIVSYIVFIMIRLIRSLSGMYFFGTMVCADPTLSHTDCVLQSLKHIYVAIEFMFEYTFREVPASGMQDIVVSMVVTYHGFLLSMYCKSRFLASMYLKLREKLSYQRFVTTLRSYYRHHTIHKSLMVRLERYLLCHWKYHSGVDVLRENTLKDEPYDIFWKVQGEVAEKIIGGSYVFAGADPGLIRELACHVKYLIMPQSSTLFLFGVLCKNVTWIIQGNVKCEFHNEHGELLIKNYESGDMISITATLLEKPSTRTYIALTDCEIIHIGISEFNKIVRRFPHEWIYLQNTIQKFSPLFDEVNEKYFTRHADYQRKLRERIFNARKSIYSFQPSKPVMPVMAVKKPKKKVNLDSELHVYPESNFMKFWLPFRAVTVLLSIIVTALIGGGGVYIKWHLGLIKTLCSAISIIDIILKLFLAYYDEKGILISERRKTIIHYLSRGFTMDVIGSLPWDAILKLLLSKDIPDGTLKLVNTTSQLAHLYMLTGYFDFLADRPSSIGALINIAKWQLVTIIMLITSSHFMINSCVEFRFDVNDNVVSVKRLDTCWLPTYMDMDSSPTPSQLTMLFAHSINMAQSGLNNLNLGRFRIREKGNFLVSLNLFVLTVIYWRIHYYIGQFHSLSQSVCNYHRLENNRFVVAYSLVVLVLVSRPDTLFQHSVNQLRNFLRSERVEKKTIQQTMAHFSYWWIRTKGLNVHTLTFERMGVIFREDLSFYFYKTTYAALDTLLQGGEQFQRQMSSMSVQMYFLAKEAIMKEMHLMAYVYVVHRGRVVVTQNGERLAVLTKGAIFGQLSGTRPRPVKVTVHAEGYADVLQMSVKHFDELLTDNVRENIKSNPESQLDYIATKKTFPENPMNTIKYILRGRKTIRLPRMASAKEAHRGNWYYRWLYTAWLLGPAASAYVTAIIYILPKDTPVFTKLISFIIFDVIQLLHTITEYFNLEITIVGDKCVYRRVGNQIFKGWRVYVNILTLVLPALEWVFSESLGFMRLIRLVRLYQFLDFYKHFCRTFKSQYASIVLKFIILTLLIHSMACGWIHVACRDDKFPIPLPSLPTTFNDTMDHNEWMTADMRNGGCARATVQYFLVGGELKVTFIVPKHWAQDYIIALTFIIILFTSSAYDMVMQVNVAQIYYKIFITFILNMVNIWLMSVAVSAVYTKFRERYQYDFSVINMTTYLERSGLSPSLTRVVVQYCRHLWDRQKGNWLPELAHQAPHCLRVDILGALYLHHILTPPLFRQLPEYFTSQLVARCGRIVIFPGQCIVKEGDINSVIFFVHEGEVEKWHNYQSPEQKFVSLLSTNGYFGFIPGLFPNTQFQFSYVSRTVVDLIYLRLKDWMDLLIAYPDVKNNLYNMARQLKHRRGEDFLKDELLQPF